MSIIDEYLPEKVRRIEEYTPNEAIYPIRLDANESPYQPSPELCGRFADIVREASYNRYPDPSAKAMIAAFCGVYGVEPDCVAAGNGSDELISILYGSFLAAGDKVMILSPDFSMYSFYDGLAEAQLIRWEKPDLSTIDFDAASALAASEKVRMVIFSNPCNPTGRVYDRAAILKFVQSLPCLCVVDEAYMDFSPENSSVLDQCGKIPNLIVLKTLSKMGLAALRVGFAVSGREIAAAIRKVKSPYNVNSLSQALACEALRSFPEFAARIEAVKRDVRSLWKAVLPLGEKGGFTAGEPGANFVTLVFADGARAKAIFEGMKRDGVIVRYTCGRCLRVTCGTPAENAAFLAAFTRCLKDENS